MKVSAATLTLALTAATGSVGIAHATDNPFTISQLSQGYMVAAATGKVQDGKCGEGKCGGAKEIKPKEGKATGGETGSAKEIKVKEAKCGEGKCGGKKVSG